MGNDLGIIRKLEIQIGERLHRVNLGVIMLLTTKGYAVDKNGYIIGLNLYNAKISEISILKNLKHLTHLDLSTNQISDISVLKQLTMLTKLNLFSNRISNISHLKDLDNLTYLNFMQNPIKKISSLKYFNNLTHLDLRGYQISDIAGIEELDHLKVLDLRENNISQLPTEITELGIPIKWEYDHRDGIFLENNPLETPPIEIVIQGTNAIRNYFKEISIKETVYLLESKLLIVGQGEVGKTTLMKKLKDNNFQVEVGKEETTHGINIVPWELNCTFEKGDSDSDAVKIHFWDFGGQDIYHATHQFFLTKRSLYLFVWDPRREEEILSFYYWLNIIRLLSANSPVIVVMNKSDVRIKNIDEANIKDKFKNIEGFYQVSCITGNGIPELTEQIRTSLSCMDHLKDKLPKIWMQIRDHLKKENKDYISLNEYFEISQEYGMNEERAEFLSDYLHDLGIILNFKHDKLLENTVILNPEWITEAVYALVDTREILENKGKFEFDDLKRYWDLTKFPREKHAQLIRLMEKFELCFPITAITTKEMYIIPELLPTKRPPFDFKKYKKPGNLHFVYHYDFMPDGIISRFISRLYFLIYKEHFWKNGVELEFDNSTALVLSEPLNRKMIITVTGSFKSELLAIIKNDFEHIHRTLNMEKNKHYDEMIPCICLTCKQSETPHFFQYEVLKRRLSKNKHHAQCLKSDDDVPIKELITGFELPKYSKDILQTLITSAHHLQGIAKTIKPDEDSRNSFIALLLSIHGFYVKDQTRWGRSETGKTMGYIDIKIENLENEAEAVIEAFRLKNFDRNVIDSHLTKLFGYDPSGLVRNFIIVYSEAADFLALWEKYLKHLPDINFKHPLAGNIQILKIQFTDIKVALTRHKREAELTEVYHLFVNMKQ